MFFRCLLFILGVFLFAACDWVPTGTDEESNSVASEDAPACHANITEFENPCDTPQKPVAEEFKVDTPEEVTHEPVVSRKVNLQGYFVPQKEEGQFRTFVPVALARFQSTHTSLTLKTDLGISLGEAVLNAEGLFELSSVDCSKLPATLRVQWGERVYLSRVIACDSTDQLQRNVNSFTTIIAESAESPIKQQETHDALAKLVMIRFFGANEVKNPNIPARTFIEGDFSQEEQLGHLLLRAADDANIQIDGESLPDAPLLGQANYINSLSQELRSAEDPSSALTELNHQPGSSMLYRQMRQLVEAETEEEVEDYQQQLLDHYEQLLTTTQSLITQIEELLEAPNTIVSLQSPIKVEAILIEGPSEVSEQSTAQYLAKAVYSDESERLIYPAWRDDHDSADIDSQGTLTTYTVDGEQIVRITAAHGEQEAVKIIRVKEVEAEMIGLRILGGSDILTLTQNTYTAVALFDDGSEKAVLPKWKDNSAHIMIDSDGVMTALEVHESELVTLTATFNDYEATKHINLLPLEAKIERIQINGPEALNAQELAQYTLSVFYDDGNEETVSAQWSIESEAATVNAEGVLQVLNIEQDQTLVLSAQYQELLSNKVISLNSLQSLEAVMTSLSIKAPEHIEENTSVVLQAFAHFDDGERLSIQPTWSVNQSFASIDDQGQLKVLSLTEDQELRVTIHYSGMEAFAEISVEDVPQICTMIFVSGIEVSVTSPSGDFISDAVVTMTDGAYEHVGYVGAGERPGTYTVRVEHGKYEAQEKIVTVKMGSDGCHVITQKVSFVLELKPVEDELEDSSTETETEIASESETETESEAGESEADEETPSDESEVAEEASEDEGAEDEGAEDEGAEDEGAEDEEGSSLNMEEFNFRFQKNDWPGGYTGTIYITNNSESAIEAWTFEFDLSTAVDDLWSAVRIESEANVKVENESWTGLIEPGTTVSFGFTTLSEGAYLPPSLCRFKEQDCMWQHQEDSEESAEELPLNEDIQVYFQKSDWPGGFTTTVTLFNGGAEEISSWLLEFDLSANFDTIWSAILVTKSDHIIVQNESWTGLIEPGQQVTFGFTSTLDGVFTPPSTCIFNEERCVWTILE